MILPDLPITHTIDMINFAYLKKNYNIILILYSIDDSGNQN